MFDAQSEQISNCARHASCKKRQSDARSAEKLALKVLWTFLRFLFQRKFVFACFFLGFFSAFCVFLSRFELLARKVAQFSANQPKANTFLSQRKLSAKQIATCFAACFLRTALFNLRFLPRIRVAFRETRFCASSARLFNFRLNSGLQFCANFGRFCMQSCLRRCSLQFIKFSFQSIRLCFGWCAAAGSSRTALCCRLIAARVAVEPKCFRVCSQQIKARSALRVATDASKSRAKRVAKTVKANEFVSTFDLLRNILAVGSWTREERTQQKSRTEREESKKCFTHFSLWVSKLSQLPARLEAQFVWRVYFYDYLCAVLRALLATTIKARKVDSNKERKPLLLPSSKQKQINIKFNSLRNERNSRCKQKEAKKVCFVFACFSWQSSFL